MFKPTFKLENDCEKSGEKNIKPYFSENDRVYYVEKKHIHDFLVAWIRLHHTPGVNPYTNTKTKKLAYVAIHKMRKNEGYWWTSPTLGNCLALP